VGDASETDGVLGGFCGGDSSKEGCGERGAGQAVVAYPVGGVGEGVGGLYDGGGGEGGFGEGVAGGVFEEGGEVMRMRGGGGRDDDMSVFL